MVATHEFTVFKGDSEGNIVRATTERKIEADQVLVKITHSGLCGTDCHYRKAGVVLGHEGVGIVEELGTSCKTLKKGDVVGWGYIHDTCNNCKKCLSGNEVFCPKVAMFGTDDIDQGSLGTHVVWKEDYLFLIPAEISPADAAPLMCAGATIFAALYDNNVMSTDTIGVVGIGGLGHLAIQFAAKMGCRVVVFSSTEDKREEAMKLGATDFYATRGLDKLEIPHSIDYMLVTTSYLPSWDLYLGVMTKQGTIIPFTVSSGNMEIPSTPFLFNGLKIVSSFVATRYVHTLMLEFAARHAIKPVLEVFPMSEEGITEAFDRMNTGKLRYRAVLEN